MPKFKSPYERGFLIITFSINFPPDGFLSAGEIPKLEQLLPPRDESIVPEDAEEVDLVKIDPQEQARSRMHHVGFHDDDEDYGPPRGGVQCQSQ